MTAGRDLAQQLRKHLVSLRGRLGPLEGPLSSIQGRIFSVWRHPAPPWDNDRTGGGPQEVPLIGSIDQPQAGATVLRGPLVVRGWHATNDSPAVAVAVSVNGKFLGHGAVGSEVRPDVADALDLPALSASGWSVLVDVGDFPTGPAQVLVNVWAGDQLEPVALAPVAISLTDTELICAIEPDSPDASTDVVGSLDNPDQDAELLERGVSVLNGWVLTERRPISRLDVTINGRAIGPARLGLARPDLAEMFDAPHALVSGFECLVDFAALPLSERVVSIELTARVTPDNPVTLVRRTVRLKSPKRVSPSTARHRLLRQRSDELRSAVIDTSDDQLNLVVFTHDLGYGGGQLWLSELLAQAGAGRDFPCTVVAPRAGPLVADLEKMGIEVHVNQDYPVHEIESYEGRLAELGAWLTTRGHNVALVNSFSSFPGVDLAGRLGIPVVWAIHESWKPSMIFSVAYPPGYVDGAVRRLAERALREAQAVIFEADATRRQYLDATGTDRALVVPYGIDTGAVQRYRARVSQTEARLALGLTEASRVILVMGTTEPRKAQTVIAEAFAAVTDQYPDALLVFVGDTGSFYAETLKEYIIRADIGDRTMLVPVVKDTYRWYRAADFLVCASDVESLPRSVLEAMCFGVPVLATAVFGLPELINDGETGFLIDPSDLTAAIRGLQRVLELDQSTLASVAEAGRRLILEKYHSSGYAQDIVALFRGFQRDPKALPQELLAQFGRESQAVE